MENNTSGLRGKLFLKPTKIQQKSEQNGNSLENGSASSASALNINNPFLKCDTDDVEASNNETKTQSPKDKKDITTNNLFKSAKPNLFQNATLSETSNFVFGQNLRERVVIDKTVEQDNKTPEEPVKDLTFSSALQTAKTPKENGESIELIATQKADSEKKDNSQSSSRDNNSMSLIEAARKYEESRGAQKRKFEEVEIITGEEDEKNILEINCKLFTFDKNNWEERGRGMLRLNDAKSSSRVVFRASGSLRVLLNTKVWKDQICELPSSKSLRLTAFDCNGLVKIYLVMGRVDDMENLFHALNARIKREKERTPEPEANNDELQKSDEEGSPEPVNKKLAQNDE